MVSHEKINDVSNYMTYDGKHLFHFTSFSSAVKIISSRTLLFGDFKSMNDISESRREVFDDNAVKELSKCQSLSFTFDKYDKRGFEIDSLWGYYAEKGNGMCLVFNKPRLISQFKKIKGFKRRGKICYIKNFSNAIFFDNDNKEPINKQIKKYYRNIFFTKSMDWHHENEFRLLIKSEYDNRATLSFDDALVAIIICMPLVERVEDACEYQIIKKITDIPILRYHTNLGNKDLTEIGGSQLWPLLGVDTNIDDS